MFFFARAMHVAAAQGAQVGTKSGKDFATQ